MNVIATNLSPLTISRSQTENIQSLLSGALSARNFLFFLALLRNNAGKRSEIPIAQIGADMVTLAKFAITHCEVNLGSMELASVAARLLPEDEYDYDSARSQAELQIVGRQGRPTLDAITLNAPISFLAQFSPRESSHRFTLNRQLLSDNMNVRLASPGRTTPN
ncbi:MAG: hypothetical protein K2W95_35265 [Candidatus Obscuribacterales bacterium]|nr:hypothetical protein [Candidatus Obscuribacterales bacterium]